MKTINYKKLLKLKEPTIIDIRTSSEYQIFHIKNSINIENKELLKEYDSYLNINKTYYLICNTGVTSKETCLFLRKFNYKIISVKKGYLNFKQF